MIFFTFSNSVDPDEMQHFTAFHLGLHCLQKYSFRGFPEYKGLENIGKHYHSKIFLQIIMKNNICVCSAKGTSRGLHPLKTQISLHIRSFWALI